VIVLVLILAVLAYALLPAPSSPVQVTFINFVSSDNTCGLNGVEYYGFNSSTGVSVPLQFGMNNSNTTGGACTIHNVVANTTGFSVAGASPLPCVVPANETVTWTVTLNVPSTNFNGVLTLIVV
jgi:hypothetical protein